MKKLVILSLILVFSIMISVTVIAQSCEEIGGEICSGEATCPVPYEEVNDTSECCPVSCIPAEGAEEGGDEGETTDTTPTITCGEIGGIICTGEAMCPVPYEEVNDTSECCPVSCVLEEGDEGEIGGEDVVAEATATCEEIGGEICSGEATCPVPYEAATDSDECCPVSCVPGEGDEGETGGEMGVVRDYTSTYIVIGVILVALIILIVIILRILKKRQETQMLESR
jgi:hypothetical protein